MSEVKTPRTDAIAERYHLLLMSLGDSLSLKPLQSILAEMTKEMLTEMRQSESELARVTAELAAAGKREPAIWWYRIHGIHNRFSIVRPPDDAYDEGTLIPLYAAAPVAPVEGRGLGERLLEIRNKAIADGMKLIDIDEINRILGK